MTLDKPGASLNGWRGGRLSRRPVLALGGAGLVGLLGARRPFGDRGPGLSTAATPAAESNTEVEMARHGRLLARSGPTTEPGPIGLQPLGLGDQRDGLLYVPQGYAPERPAPLVLMLHGAGGVARHSIDLLRPRADEHGLILLAPDSRDRTWDVLLGGFGPDVAFIDRALTQTFGRYAVDPARVAVEGFSDGASYALSLGLTNGDLFGAVVAFSPGFLSPETPRGMPRIYVSHGIQDDVLPIDYCSRRIVPSLERAGYDVTYHEFDGPHTVPPEIVDEALAWLAAEVATPSAT